MNTEQLVKQIDLLIKEYTEEFGSNPAILYLDNVNYHKLTFLMQERGITGRTLSGKPVWERLVVFKVDVLEDHVNVS